MRIARFHSLNNYSVYNTAEQANIDCNKWRFHSSEKATGKVNTRSFASDPFTNWITGLPDYDPANTSMNIAMNPSYNSGNYAGYGSGY